MESCQNGPKRRWNYSGQNGSKLNGQNDTDVSLVKRASCTSKYMA